jgi:hypothetical protein
VELHVVAMRGGVCKSPGAFSLISELEQPFLACATDGSQVFRCIGDRWTPHCGCPGGCRYTVWKDGSKSGSELRCLNANGRLLDHGPAVSGQCEPGGCDRTAGTGTCEAGGPSPWACIGAGGEITADGCRISWRCGDDLREIRCQGLQPSECLCLRAGVEEGRFTLPLCSLRPLELESAANAACGWRLPSPAWP